MKPRFGVMISSFLFLLVGWGPSFSEQNHYCSISRDHTLCKFQGVGPRCKQPMELGIGSRERQEIMNMHNSLRLMVATGAERRGRGGAQPSASNMRQMEWDDELALSAQRLAEQCKYNHDCLNCRKVDRFLTGQNLYQFSENIERPGSNWDQAIMAWYDEVADWSPRHIDHFEFIKPLGHYTQMLWADTYKMGCGYVYYKDGKWNRKLYVCNYGPAGNIITTQMYKRGAPCSECPEGTSCSNSYPGLCSGGGGGSRPSFFHPAPAPVTPRATTPRSTTTTTPRTTTTKRTTTTTPTTTPRPTTRRTTTERITYPTTQRTYPTTYRTFPTTHRTFPTTHRTFPTTTHPSKIIFNELESNELGADTFNQPAHTHTTHLELSSANRFGQNKGRTTKSPSNRFSSFQQNRYHQTTPTTTTTTQRTTPRLTFSRFITTTTTPRKPPTTPAYNQFHQNTHYYQRTTPAPTKTTTTTRKPFTFSPRVYPSEEGKRNRIKNSIDSFPTRRPVQQFPQSKNRISHGSPHKNPESKVVRVSQTPALSVEDSTSILLFCDFDYAKCPVRSMGMEGWNYTAYETPGYGHGFGSIVRPGGDSSLQIRSDIFPTNKDGMICVHFRFVHYLYGTDGGYQKSTGVNPDTGKPVAFTVNAEPTGASSSTNTRVEFGDKSKSGYDWLTGRIQFKDLHSQFLLSFEVPKNQLDGDNEYLAVDDILITQGVCHT